MTVGRRNSAGSSGRLSAAQLTNNGQSQIQESYFYDALGNATTRSELWGSGAAQKGYIEFLGYDNLNRLQTSQLVGGALQNFTYDAAGDILTKAGVGTGNYVYPTQGAGSVRPHAVQSITGVTGSFGYDANGNMTSSPFGRTQTWTSFDMPLVLSQGANSSQFYYGPEHQRAKQVRSDGTTIWYAGGIEVETSASQTRVKTYWPHGLGLEIDSGGATQELWTHVDRLGSVVAVTDVNGTLQVQDAFDVWGTRRNTDGTAAAAPIIETLDNKGFTGQEMLDQLALVHLNGRVYDPTIGRFLSGDPQVTDPHNGQNYNRYSYVLNNPTNLTDPTGYAWQDIIPVYGSVVSFGEEISDGHFLMAAAYGGMAVEEGLTLGVGAVVKGAIKSALKSEVKHEAAEQLAKQGGEQAAHATEKAATEAAHATEAAGSKAAGEGSSVAKDSSAVEKESAKNPGKNKNSNDAEGNFGVYEITVDGKTYKFGKADLDRVTESSGLPTRLHQQLRKLREANPESRISGKVLEEGHATTAEAKAAETKRIEDHVDKTGEVPPGNQKSFQKPEPPPPPPPPKIPE